MMDEQNAVHRPRPVEMRVGSSAKQTQALFVHCSRVVVKDCRRSSSFSLSLAFLNSLNFFQGCLVFRVAIHDPDDK